MRIVLSGIFYPMAILRYFEAALNRRDDIDLFTAGPYTGSLIPWNGGMHLPAKYARAPNMAWPANGQLPRIPISHVEQQLPFKPDLWLQIDAGWHFYGKPRHGKNFIVGTDPHVLNYDHQRQLADKFFCMQTPYAQRGDEYLPYAYDPEWHRPEEQPHNFDACLIGLHYEERNQWVNLLRQRGVNVYYDLGPSFDEARALYNQAPIGLNWSSRLDLTARVFELLGMGRLAIVNDVPDLKRFFENGKHLISFRNVGEAVEAVCGNLGDPNGIAAEGHKAVKEHTWDARIEQIFEAAV